MKEKKEKRNILRYYRMPALSKSAIERVLVEMQKRIGLNTKGMKTELCFYVQVAEPLIPNEILKLQWLLAGTSEESTISRQTFLSGCQEILEVGPRLNFETSESSTAVSICHACGLSKVARLEKSRRFGLPIGLAVEQQTAFLAMLHDRMTEVRYYQPLKNFDSGLKPASVRVIPVIKQGIEALKKINIELGLAMDEQDLLMCYDLFVNQLGRNPTDVEISQLGQSNSEHSRHHFFNGKLIIDGALASENLMKIVKAPLKVDPGNSLIAFCDDSSAIRGSEIATLIPAEPSKPSAFVLSKRLYHSTLTAETHNFPSGVAPYPGAATGTGGRIRDNQAVGRGGLVIAGGAAYCTGNLHIPGYALSWEEDGWSHPSNLASPLKILIQASNGASDYGNCFGEPVIFGFARAFEQNLPDGYRSWFKPVMYTVGAGQIDNKHITKDEAQKGILVVQIGGPAYRIGLGGAAASSMIQGENVEELDFNAVQRGAPEMEQRANRLIRACIEMSEKNSFVSIHDLGAGGDCNALPELVYPAGAKINLRTIPLGDKSLSVLEYWGNESQERHAFLIWPNRFEQIKEICDRENIPCAVVGEITGDGRIVLYDKNNGSTPVNLPLDEILGDIPPKTFELERIPPERLPLELPENLTVREALIQVLRLPSVASKRFLTTKVDRSVTGLIAQQQCVGPNQLTLSDFAITAQSHFDLTGTALSLGEQPIKGLISPEAMARLAVAEALLNMVGAKITSLADIKCSANWMLAAKEPGEGAWLYDAARALRDILIQLGIAIDGGKDSLSMAAKTIASDGSAQTIKAPGQLVIANYATMVDITCKVTPDLKQEGNTLLFIDLACGKNRLGGSALAQVCKQVGDDCPDVGDVDLLKHAFETTQEMIEKGLILSVHDRSDGGLIVSLLEMAFSGNVGLTTNLRSDSESIGALFNEEIGLVVECERADEVMAILSDRGIPVQKIGTVGHQDGLIMVNCNGKEVLREKMTDLRQIWEETSTQIDMLQANPECVKEEALANARLVTPPLYSIDFKPQLTPKEVLQAVNKPKVAILREEGSNGDREMASAFYLAGFEVWDVTISDLLKNKVSLDDFDGIAFVGGFSFADVLGAGKGWAGVIRFNEQVAKQFTRFYQRPDTFSLGVCNGCQLMALLGWVPWYDLTEEKQPRFIRNKSERFESRFATVRILPSPAVMLRGMEGSCLGVWVAHAEGQLFAQDDGILKRILEKGLAPLRFVDIDGLPTTAYPFNPNGSLEGITALCSPDGRHLAMMPHPERTFLSWQWPWMPREWKDLPASPWLRLFQNAYDWYAENTKKK